jgi:hypothetical protein
VEMSGDEDSAPGYFGPPVQATRRTKLFINNRNHHYKISTHSVSAVPFFRLATLVVVMSVVD